MAQVYSISEAKAKFSELIRRVRAGQRITITHRGKEVVEILPIPQTEGSLKDRLKVLEARGVLSRGRKPLGKFKPLAKRPGALARFLRSRARPRKKGRIRLPLVRSKEPGTLRLTNKQIYETIPFP